METLISSESKKKIMLHYVDRLNDSKKEYMYKKKSCCTYRGISKKNNLRKQEIKNNILHILR